MRFLLLNFGNLYAYKPLSRLYRVKKRFSFFIITLMRGLRTATCAIF
nr:MAG TPA: hypothetical protein [Caudoviricetes sp.]